MLAPQQLFPGMIWNQLSFIGVFFGSTPMPERFVLSPPTFDQLFELAAGMEFKETPEVFSAPVLPPARSFRGIVHVHGSVNNPHEMVLTDIDFGRVYLTEGWARRFLISLFREFKVLFVGYSHSDTVCTILHAPFVK